MVGSPQLPPVQTRLLPPLPTPRFVRRSSWILWLFLALIVAVNLSPLMAYHTPSWLFDVNREGSIASWYSVVLLLGIALAATACRVLEGVVREDRRAARGWGLVALLFLFLSLDEGASLHETIGILFAKHVGEFEKLPGVYMWVIVLVPPAAATVFMLARALVRAWGWRHPVTRSAVAGFGCWLLVPLVEVLEPVFGTGQPVLVLEESLEFAGELLVLQAFLVHLRERQKVVRLALVAPRTGDSGPYAKAS